MALARRAGWLSESGAGVYRSLGIFRRREGTTVGLDVAPTEAEALGFAALDDMGLIEACVLGDRRERDRGWRALHERFRAPLLTTAYRVVGARAEECVDEFFQHLYSYNKLRAYLRTEGVTLLPYIRRALQNFARREYMRLVGSRPAEPEEPAYARQAAGGAKPEENAQGTELAARIRAQLAGFDQADRVAFVLRFWGEIELDPDDLAWIESRSGSGAAEVRELLRRQARVGAGRLAKLMGIGLDAFYQKIHRARARLAAALEIEKR